MNYTKWDKLEISDDEGEPCLTCFPTPQSVTFGKGNQHFEEATGEAVTAARPRDRADQDDSSDTFRSEATQLPINKHKEDLITVTSAGSGDDVLDITAACRNGAILTKYIWTQNKQEVTAYINLEQQIRGPELIVELFRKQEELTSASLPDHQLRESGTMLSIKRRPRKSANLEIVLDAELTNQVLIDEDSINWEVKSYSKVINLPSDLSAFPEWLKQSDTPLRVLVITLTKSTPISGAVMWWKSFIKGDAEIDVQNIPDRHQPKCSGLSFKEVWEEANKRFIEDRKNDPEKIGI